MLPACTCNLRPLRATVDPKRLIRPSAWMASPSCKRSKMSRCLTLLILSPLWRSRPPRIGGSARLSIAGNSPLQPRGVRHATVGSRPQATALPPAAVRGAGSIGSRGTRSETAALSRLDDRLLPRRVTPGISKPSHTGSCSPVRGSYAAPHSLHSTVSMAASRSVTSSPQTHLIKRKTRRGTASGYRQLQG